MLLPEHPDVEPVIVDLEQCVVTYRGVTICRRSSDKPLRILALLARRPHRIGYEEVLREVWGKDGEDLNCRAITTHATILRRWLRSVGCPEMDELARSIVCRDKRWFLEHSDLTNA